MSRQAIVERKTTETQITVEWKIDGAGNAEICTGIPFMDHMLTLFARHGFFDLKVEAEGDLEVDAHHTMEDLGLTMGKALSQALDDKAGIHRYGFFYLPMDETLARVVVDLSGRPCLMYDVDVPRGHMLGGMDVRLFREFMQAFTNAAALNLHIDLIRGEDMHHIFEAIFKGLARALDMATRMEPREKSIPSTKGTLV